MYQLECRLTTLERAVAQYLEKPDFLLADDVGFNGQIQRKAVLKELFHVFPFEQIVETGTYVGDTAGYLASTFEVPVITAEMNRHFHLIAKRRLASFSAVRQENLDSRGFLQKLSAEPAVTRKKTFFYLDAHWESDLPLRQEVEIIINGWPDYLILVDDFQVPGDSGYGYDDYGAGDALCVDYIKSITTKNSISIFFPTISSEIETGAKRGYVIITKKSEAALFKSCNFIQEYSA